MTAEAQEWRVRASVPTAQACSAGTEARIHHPIFIVSVAAKLLGD